ncbi:hypothetical protein GWI33_016108 [Rhynchophorus ferrugineus]|uniref:Uncharacterized protein n=1 Tax=Rhynchophorus ferrugineus TaxID=354439 RepID=A0A834HXZ1_RHYFE|nr:hypothetical protein GWI33_016108 [Rhynchophorus ferrugineus]
MYELPKYRRYEKETTKISHYQERTSTKHQERSKIVVAYKSSAGAKPNNSRRAGPPSPLAAQTAETAKYNFKIKQGDRGREGVVGEGQEGGRRRRRLDEKRRGLGRREGGRGVAGGGRGQQSTTLRT